MDWNPVLFESVWKRRVGTAWRLAPLALVLLAFSCNHREEVRKSKLQQKEIQQLQAEFDQLEADLKALPRDRQKELDANRKRAEILDQNVARLAPEVSDLLARKTALEKDALSYRSQHPLKPR
ncbi:MAG: hypothetical protein QM755_06935 [Luteolibacter sp.]